MFFQAPGAAPMVREPAVKLRPFFWSKLAWRPDAIWANVPAQPLTEEQLRALEALFPQTAASPAGKGRSKGVWQGDTLRLCAIRYAAELLLIIISFRTW